MRGLLDAIARLSYDDGFTTFQDEVVHAIYDGLGQGYSRGENEVALVERLLEATNGKGHGPIHLLAQKIHGSRSYVEFNYMDRPVTRELGDLAVVTVVTDGRERLLQRLCIVQNKKGGDKSWQFDMEQLFLLKNFPPFTGDRGIFRGCPHMVFRNMTGVLGAYGLLESPGEMLFVSAPLLSELTHGKKSVAKPDIAVVPGHQSSPHANLPFGWSFFWPLHRYRPMEWLELIEEMYRRHGYLPGPTFGQPGGWLSNMAFCRDLFDWVRHLTQLSIGEFTFAFDRILNAHSDAFANFLLRSAGFGDIYDIPGDEVFGDRRFEGAMAVIVIHVDVQPAG